MGRVLSLSDQIIRLFAAGLLMLVILGRLGLPPILAQSEPEAQLRQLLLAASRTVAVFESALPDFVCQEELAQTITAPNGRLLEQQRIESRLTGRQRKETDRAGLKYSFEESREIATINGKALTKAAAATQRIPPPYLGGAFSSILVSHFALASLADFNWALAAPASLHGRMCQVVTFTPTEGRHRQVYQYDGRIYDSRRVGRAFIDLETRQVARIEYKEINLPPDLSAWQSSVDYAPVPLDDKTFWLPVTATTELHDQAAGRILRATHRYHGYKRFTGSLELDDK